MDAELREAVKRAVLDKRMYGEGIGGNEMRIFMTLSGGPLLWTSRWWWRYLLGPKGDPSKSWATVIKCRRQGHPGIVGYDPNDDGNWIYHCRRCGDRKGM